MGDMEVGEKSARPKQFMTIIIEIHMHLQGSKLKKMSGRKFATSCENLVATLKMLVAKLIEAI